MSRKGEKAGETERGPERGGAHGLSHVNYQMKGNMEATKMSGI